MSSRISSRTGFSLMELLVAVAITSILSSIAFIRISDAQARGKISRTMADLRAIGDALEAYHVDNNEYPDADLQGHFQQQSKIGFMLGDYNDAALSRLSTPVAYLGEPLVIDPFVSRKTLRDPQVARYAPVHYGYCQMEAIMEPAWEMRDETLTSFSDAMMGLKYTDGELAQFKAHRWIVQSVGPDGINFPLQGTPESNFPRAFQALTNRKHLSYIYDPTNGSASSGDLVLTAKGFLK